MIPQGKENNLSKHKTMELPVPNFTKRVDRAIRDVGPLRASDWYSYSEQQRFGDWRR